MHGAGRRSATDRGVEGDTIVVAGKRVRSRFLVDETAPGDFMAKPGEMPPDDGAADEEDAIRRGR